MTDSEILALPFDIERHKQSQYLLSEFVIAPDGTIYYALPSHTEFLVKKVCERKNCTRKEVEDTCPPEYYANYLAWLIEQSDGYIPVWEPFVLEDSATKQQLASLKLLKLNGLYRGKLPLLRK